MIHKPSTITQINKDIQYKRVIRTTLTITLITFNQIICFTLPDIAILFFDLPYNIGFYVMNLNNGNSFYMIILGHCKFKAGL